MSEVVEAFFKKSLELREEFYKLTQEQKTELNQLMEAEIENNKLKKKIQGEL